MPIYFCKACDDLIAGPACLHGPELHVELSADKIRELLCSSGQLPRESTRPQLPQPGGDAHPLSIGPSASALKVTADRATSARYGRRQGFILWFTGLSGAGKSTLAQAVRIQLLQKMQVEVLDGDEVRTYLSKGLGFSKEDRDTNVRRIGYVARVVARNGVAAITAAISPYAQVRHEVRQLATAEGVSFVEVFVHAELTALVERDVKGLYKKAIAGEIQHFTGVNDPYEPPGSPELVVRTDQESVDESVARIIGTLSQRGLIPQPRS